MRLLLLALSLSAIVRCQLSTTTCHAGPHGEAICTASPIANTATVPPLEGQHKPDVIIDTVPIKQPSWVFLGGQANASTHPQPTGFAAVALPIGGATWSYSQYSVYFVGNKPVTATTTGLEQAYFPRSKPVTATTTGLAKSLWCLSWACVVGLGTVGTAQTGTATTSAFNGGGGVNVPKLGKLPFGLFVGAIQAKGGGGNQTQIVLAAGRSW